MHDLTTMTIEDLWNNFIFKNNRDAALEICERATDTHDKVALEYTHKVYLVAEHQRNRKRMRT